MGLLLNVLCGCVIFVAVISTPFVIYIFYRKIKLQPDISASGIRVNNYLSQFADGSQAGWEESVKQHPSGRLICKYNAIDDPDNLQVKTVVVGRNSRILTSNGKIKTVYYLPRNVDELPQELKGTVLGELQAKMTMYNNADETRSEGIKREREKTTEVIRKITDKKLIHDIFERLMLTKKQEEEQEGNPQ